jgi:hypothetical protein
MPAFSWGKVFIGDYNLSHSKFSLDGITIRGGALELMLNGINISLAGGRSRRAISRLPQPSFERELYAAKVSLGDAGKPGIALSVLRGIDDSSSISNLGNIYPRENLVVDLKVNIELVGELLTLSGEAARSSNSRNVYVPEKDNDQNLIPGSGKFYTDRVGTAHSNAFNAELKLDYEDFEVKGSYKRIEPGFYSMGMPWLISDLEEWRIVPILKLINNRVILRGHWASRRNNLKNDRLFTTNRDQFGVFASYRHSRHFSIVGRYRNYAMDNSRSRDSLRTIDNATLSYLVQPNVMFEILGLRNQVLVAYSFQQFENEQQDYIFLPGYKNSNLNVKWDVYLNRNLILRPSFLSINQKFNINDADIQQYSLGARYKFNNPQIQLSLNVGMLDQEFSTGISSLHKLSIRFSGLYRIAKKNYVRIEFWQNSFERENIINSEVTERKFSLRYIHNF